MAVQEPATGSLALFGLKTLSKNLVSEYCSRFPDSRRKTILSRY